MGKPLPAFSTLDELRSLYTELSAPVQPYYKSVVRVKLSKKSFVERTVVHLRAEHADLRPESYRGAVAVERTHGFTEVTAGLLYTPQVSTEPRHLSPEWALVFKIDCDLSRAKTGSIEPALAHYVAESALAQAPDLADRVHAERDKLEGRRRPPRPGEGRPRKHTNSEDLLARYGRKRGGAWDLEHFPTRWIFENREALDADPSFAHDGYRDYVQAHSAGGLEEVARDGDELHLHFGRNHAERGDE